jgi:uncharacterized protein (DUF1778 family)
MQKPRRETSIQVRLLPGEKQDFERAAAIEGLSISSWTRQALRDRARGTLAKAGQKPSYNGGAEG